MFEYFGLISLICFSFFITDQTAMVVQEVDEIMVSIKDEMSNYETKGINAKIIDNTIIPGVSGKIVDVNKSYQYMKEKGLYDSSFYVYDTQSPTISVSDNLDKYIISGNTEKMMVSLVFVVDNRSIIDVQNIVGDTPISFIIGSYNVDKEIDDIIITSKLDNDIIISTSNDENYRLLNNKLESINVEVNFCFNDKQDNKFLQLCKNNNQYSIYVGDIISKYPLKTVKKQLTSGSILIFKINDEVLKELPNIISYIKSRGYSIETLSNHLSENW